MKARFLALVALVLGVVSCQTEPEGLDVNVGGEQLVTINVAVPETETRAGYGNSALGVFNNGVLDGAATMRYILQVYYKTEENGEVKYTASKERLVEYSDGKSVAFEVRLVPERDYQFVVWADVVTAGKTDTDNHYNTENLANIQLNNPWVAMDESRDAFTATKLIEDFKSTSTIDITLKRPFAKLRVVTTDMKALNNLGIEPKKATVTYTVDHYNAFNALFGNAIGDSKNRTIKHENYDIASYGENVAKGADMTLFSDYFFAEDDVVKFDFDVYDQNGKLIKSNSFKTDIYAKRNYLTTIKGNILTDGKNFDVTIDDAFENGTNWNPGDDKYDVEIWDGKTLTAPKYNATDDVWEISTGSQLAWLAAAVSGTLDDTRATLPADSFKGKTFRLTEDINLGENAWKPIGLGGKHFEGIFDGQGHVITGLKITERFGGDRFALFCSLAGSAQIKNVVIDNAYIKYPADGEDCYASAIAGTIYGDILFEGITVKNSTITGNNKVGAIFAHDGSSTKITINDCHVDNCYIASEDLKDGGCVGGLVGYFATGNEGKPNTISNSSVKNTTIVGINSSNNGKRANSLVIGSIKTKATMELNIVNCVLENNTFSQTIDGTAPVTYVGTFNPQYIGGDREEAHLGKITIDGYEVIANGVGMKDGEYYIQSVAGLKWLAEQVNGGNSFSNKTVKLSTDLDLNNEEWTPIGLTETKSFSGAFDGQGKTIYNLRIDSNSRAGLFGYVGRDSGSNDGNVYGAIRNLKLHNVNMKTSSGAALCGNLFRGEISDIELTGKVTIEGTNQNVAGVVGYHYGNLANITVDVTEDSYVKSATGYCGGVASYSGEGDYTKTNIESNIKVIASGEAVGGLFALLQYGNSATDCSCSATVINDCAVDSHNRYVRTGGIAGCWVENASAKTTLTGCEFTGTVKATRQDGLTASKLAHGGLVGASYNTAGYGELNIDGKKYVDVYKSAGLANAVKLEGYTIYMTAGPWGDGVNITEYTMPTSIADNVTIEGVKEAILNMNNISEISGADNLTIDGITVNWNGNTYSGFTHSTGHVYKNITFNGAFFCWNQSARFENCAFNLNANQYIWTYGCNVDFERCTFNCVDGKGILIYNEGTDVTVNINNCEFSSSKHAQTGNGQNIAAIEISNAVNNPKFTVSINNCVSKGGFAYDDFICRFKDEVTAENLANLNVTVDGLKYVSEGRLEDAEGNTIATSVAGLRDALKEGEDVILADDMAIENSESESNNYGKTGINMTNGGTIDGGGNDISINAWATWDSAINTTGGTIKNINVTGGMRGIFVNHNSDNCSKVYLENVVVDGTVYTISCDQGTGNGLEAINSTFNGWTSYAATIGDVKFTNCNFGEGQGYAYCRPYAPTEFVGCEFEAGFTLEPCAAVTFENCTFGGVTLTDANLGELVTDTTKATIK